MKQTLFTRLKQGHSYIKLWPNKHELSQYFPEYRAVVTCRFALKYCPSLALCAFILPLFLFGIDRLNIAIFYGILIGSMPIQGLVIAAKQSQKKLPLSLASWYRDAVEKLKEKTTINLTLKNPTYYDLARLLKYSYQ